MSHDHSHIPASNNGALNKRAATFAIILAVTLVILKLYAWEETDSLSIFSSLVDSSLDVITSVINMLAIGYALKPADEEHTYGHDSIEDIVGLIQATFIFGGACFILYEGVQRFFNPVELQDTGLGIAVIAFSVAATVALVIYQKITVRKTKSIVVESDSMHYFSDVLSGVLIILSLFISNSPRFHYVDPLLALCIGLYISYNAYIIGRRAFDNLMNREISDEDKAKILAIINASKKHNGYHDFKTRASGTKIFVQFDLEIDGELTLRTAHDIANEVMLDIMKEFPNSEVTIHLDPEKD